MTVTRLSNPRRIASDGIGSAAGTYGTDQSVDYIVVGGGGGGASRYGGGGGAGGFVDGRVNVPAGTYSVTVGAGGAGATIPGEPVQGANGNESWFWRFAGMRGGRGQGANPCETSVASSGGRAGTTGTCPAFSGQGIGGATDLAFAGGGGGGAGGPGANSTGGSAGAGGSGATSAISGAVVTYAGGGGGGVYVGFGVGGPGGAGGSGGGGKGRGSTIGTNGTANTGGGGGGGGGTEGQGAAFNGGSGVVVISVRRGRSVSFSVGLTATSATVGGRDVYTVTAGAGTVTLGA